MTRTASEPAVAVAEAGSRSRALGGGAAIALTAVALALVAAWHLSQGTSGVGAGELLQVLTGGGTDDARNVLWGSRLPRLAAGVAVGVALGVAGVLMQTLARNPLASPDTLGVTAGSYLAVTAVAAFGIAVPLWASGLLAFAGGLAAAGIVLGLAGGAGTSSTRLVLAGSALALAFQALTSALLILFQEETKGLLAWGSGSLAQLNLDAALRALPLIAVAVAAALLLSHRLDVFSLGDDLAKSLGVPLGSTRVSGILLAVALSATAVTLAGPIGFVGLCAPVLARLLARWVPALERHAFRLPAAGLIGAVLVLGADAVLRAVLGAAAAVSVPTGVATTLAGAIVLVVLARGLRGGSTQAARVRAAARSARRFWITLAVLSAALVAVVILGALAGNTMLRTGDLALWLQGTAPPPIALALDERAPRVLAAILAGAALALAGGITQSISRNPLADPGLLGITGGAGLGAVLVVTGGLAGTVGITVAATVGSLLAFALVYGLSWRGGLSADRLVLIGIGGSAGATALTTFFLLRADPWNTPAIYTWLSGTTYGRSFAQVLPVLIVLAVAVPLVLAARREVDLIALDEDTPRALGVRLERTRLGLLALAAVLAAASVTAVGVVGFVGLLAPHAARALVGARTARFLPTAAVLGAVLVGVADAVGRTVIAPAQLPAGLMVALLGAPYFVWLLWRTRDA
ncbi:iron complex transport system permease protein [Leucobacter komagatae]|uniref:Iron complex transport system permease protein n=1 Tax=Leucobacter komagatae TaxID=55969 RepID=A0A542Y8U7_9MICO|nr:iron ABC transporter permease [Leucobacter komagatae]TQL44509.1 iron complex transport system permease protein [Leucobacter komagatae]